MKSFFSTLAAGLSGAVLLAGCASTSPARLKTENLFRDEIPHSAETVADYDALIYRTSSGMEIYGQILKPDRSFGDKRPCVLMFHGFAGFGRFDDIGQALCRAGCVVVIPHHRGAWGSPGKYSISNCVQDAVALVWYMKRVGQGIYHIDPEAVFLIGHSMGGNTVLNAATEIPGVRGIVMMAPCDIGTMYRQMPKEKIKKFMIENGLEVLHTDGFEAVYSDLGRHAERYAFPNAVKKLKNVRLFLATGEWDTCISNDLLKVFFEAARSNKTLPDCSSKCYPAKHGLMGVRTQLTRDIADFILKSLEKE